MTSTGTPTAPASVEVSATAESPWMARTRRVALSSRGTIGVVVGLVIWWEALARSGLFHELFMPTVGEVVGTFREMAISGFLWEHTIASVIRLFLGLGVAAVVGVGLGMMMGRFRLPEEFLIPLVSFLLPIPALAWIPLFMLWFGLGNRSILPLVVFSATLPIAINTWTGIKTVKPIWVRAARTMNIRGGMLFRKVILPGALPLIIIGLRIGMAQAWRAVIAGELVASAASGLGVVIFNGKQFVNVPMMLASLVVIGALSQVFEKVVFAKVEDVTVGRWGTLQKAGAT